MLNQYKANILNPSRVLLTGATGYIGAFLLERLIRSTQADVFCLVRATSPEEGMERIKKTLQSFRAWDDSLEPRIRPLVGDLAKPLLGLSQSQFSELASTVDMIYHSGALVNFSYPYATLKGPNVFGTQEVLRLACQGKPKAVHYMGTVDTLLATHIPRPWLEIEPPNQPRREVPDGYMLSKWAAETLVLAARSRGVPVCIYRPPWTISHTKTGASPMNNFLLVELKSYLQFGLFPDNPLSEPFSGAPVDFLAEAIVYLSKQEASLGKIFHPWNPHAIPYNQLYEWIWSFGYKFDVAPRSVVLERVKKVEPTHPIYPLIPILTRAWTRPDPHPDALTFDPRLECANALKGLEGSGIEIPPTSEKLVHLCLSYLIDRGFLDPPSS